MDRTTNANTIAEDDQLALSLPHQMLRKRYLRKDSQGRVVETDQQMSRRVATAIAESETRYGAARREIEVLQEQFYQPMADRRFLPNSPTLMNAGREMGVLSACFVLPVKDSIDGIFDSIKHTALLQKAGGGTGFAFDELRPTGDYIKSSGGKTSGPISFWRAFSEATNAIQQGAFRRGANMGMMYAYHPDVLKFLHAKQDTSAFANYNISVKLTDEWMQQFIEDPDSPHIVRNPRTGEDYYIPTDVKIWDYDIRSLIPAATKPPDSCLSTHSQTPIPVGPLPANHKGKVYTKRDIWALIVNNAWRTGEPGICFIDRINDANPTPHVGRIEATNPCGEQPLLPYESCNLGSINLANFVDVQTQGVRWDSLGEAIHLAVRFLDDVIDASHYPIDQVREATLGNRKIGLGIMGFADALVLLGIRYDSEEAVRFAGKVGQLLAEAARDASESLAQTRGTFPNWEGSVWDTQHHKPMRNATCTTIAPTGSISIIAECSSGIEPIFSLAGKRRALDGQEFVHVHPLLEQLGGRDGWMNDRIRTALLKDVRPRDIAGFPDDLADVLVTAHEVAPEWHVRVQAAFQKHIDSAVSKTVNLSANATTDDVDRIYRLAYELGCKGITVYRDGSREGQTLSVATSTDKPPTIAPGHPRPRARVTAGRTFKFRMGCGTLFVTPNCDERGPCEVFANLGKAGGCPAQTEATCRAISAGLRSGVDPRVFIEQLRGIRCLSAARKRDADVDVLSCPDAIARAMEEAWGESVGAEQPSRKRSCPDCGKKLRKEAGCFVCDACGYSKCG